MQIEKTTQEDKYSNLSEEERITKAKEVKADGNAAYKKGLYARAMNCYSEAIEIIGPKHKGAAPFYCNRAMCQLKVEAYRYAIDDGEAALLADPTFAKGYYRQASGYTAIGKLDEAIKCLKTIKAKLKQNTADVRKKLKELRDLKKEKLFFESIYREDEIEKMDPENLEVEASYTGPKLDNKDAPITAEWAKEAIEWMKNQKKIHKKFVWIILKRISALLEQDSTLVEVDIPDDGDFTVCGDIHGQYYDLLNIWTMNGFPSKTNPYLFNGDFVDRGSFSVECMLALYIYKLYDPTCIYLNRGNHEGRNMNKMYGFEGEVKAKYDIGTFDLFAYSFDRLSLCHVLNKQVMVCHGGLFEQDGVTLNDIKKIKRNRDIPEKGIYTDMLWSDPCKMNGRMPSKRGVSIQFGPDIAEKFLNENGLSLLVRSHEVKEDGYEIEPNGKVVTVFSAPKYCDQMTNRGAYIKFKGNEMKPKFVQFDAVPHPNVPAMHYARNMMFR